LRLLKCWLSKTHIKTNAKPMKNTATNNDQLPPLVSNILHDKRTHVDNLFADAWRDLKFGSLLSRSGFRKRSGTDIVVVIYLLLVWRWINVSSIGKFSEKAIGLFSDAHRDVMYDTLKREDVNWRKFNLQIARAVYDRHSLGSSRSRVFVLDDSIKSRRGKKMEGMSSHFDHVSNTHVMGQQVLTLALATEESFLPLDSQIFISDKKVQPLIKPYNDARSVAAKRHKEAVDQTKNQMAEGMLRRAVRESFSAEYVVADAWFGNKQMIGTALSLGLTAILRMKKSKLKYRVKHGRQWQHLDAKELYQLAVRKQWTKVRNLPWKAVEMTVQVNLTTDKSKNAQADYRSVKLLFVRGIKEEPDSDGSAKDWALFLSTATELASSKILETYSLRWGIEVYFKEAKQHLGFLQEQTITFASHIASIHLCAIRYLILISGKLDQTGATVGLLREQIQDQLNSLSFATQLWQIFRAIINGSLNSICGKLNCSVAVIMKIIDKEVEVFFVKSLQLDVYTMRLEHE